VHKLPSLESSGVPGEQPPFAAQVSAPLQTLPSEQLDPTGAFASTGQVADEPEQTSAGSHKPVDPRHVAPALPAGCWQTRLVPSQRSSVQGLPSSAQAVPPALGEQVPTKPGRLHAEQSPMQARLQQTPLAQNPELHWLAFVQTSPLDGS
jgi:hypothetical protein